MKRLIFDVSCLILAICCSLPSLAQRFDPSAFMWRNIGPANQGGRIVDIEALRNDFAKVWAATGSGGVWYSANAGTTWRPIFDDYSTASIGDIAIDQNNPQNIWIGTGESNNRNSVSWGNGVYLSEDGGEHFKNVGLENTHHISRVIIHPGDGDNVCVCAMGHLWGEGGDRGVFMTQDKGQSWIKKTRGLPQDPNVGCTDLIKHPTDPNIMYVAMYYRLRKPWTFTSGNENGGIFKSMDGGDTWTKLTNGLPTEATGRIGLAISESNPEVVMALVEAPRTDDLSKPGSGVYRSEDGGVNWQYVNTYNNRPFYYSQIRINPLDDQRVYLLTTSFMVSTDGGNTFNNGSDDQEVHGDFHAMWLDPSQGDRYYLGADKGMSLTHDHGSHFQLFDNLPIGQFYRISVDMNNPYRIYGGLQDNGFYGISSFSRETRGVLNDSNWKLHWGDGQFSAVDPTDPNVLFTSAENGSYMRYNVSTYEIDRISPASTNIENFSAYISDEISRPFRFNWSAPLVMSPHDPNTLFVAGNHVFKSENQGKTWRIISPDLSTNDSIKSLHGQSGGITPDNTGAETHCAMTTLSVSPINESIMWAGTDDGQVHVTKDGGLHWHSVRPDVPQLWISRLEASHFESGRAYLTLDGHRSDVFSPWVYITEDFGKTWKSISSDLPEDEVIRVIREDLENEDLLFLGSETGVWYSLNRGTTWHKIESGFPTVSVYDLVIHPRDHDLVVGTHGRSIWILDHIYPLQQLTPSVQSKDFHLFEQEQAILWLNKSRGGQRGHFWYAGDNPPEIRSTSSLPRARYDVDAMISYFSGFDHDTLLHLGISSAHGRLDTTVLVVPGINFFRWNRQFTLQDYSDEEIREINVELDKYLSSNQSGTLRRAVEQFRTNVDSYSRRSAIQALMDGFLKLPLPAHWGIPTAGPGVYKIKLCLEEDCQTKYIELVADPLVAEN